MRWVHLYPDDAGQDLLLAEVHALVRPVATPPLRHNPEVIRAIVLDDSPCLLQQVQLQQLQQLHSTSNSCSSRSSRSSSSSATTTTTTTTTDTTTNNHNNSRDCDATGLWL